MDNQHSSSSSFEATGSTSSSKLITGKTRINFDEITDVEISKFVKEHNAELRFPEKLMLLIMYLEMESSKRGDPSSKACLSWTRDGSAFIIRNQHKLENHVLPLVFEKGKFSSFTRKLYRWGFRQILPKTNKRDKESQRQRHDESFKIFFHEDFQRDNKNLLINMRSMTAELLRKSNRPVKSNDSESSITASVPPPSPDGEDAGLKYLSAVLQQESSLLSSLNLARASAIQEILVRTPVAEMGLQRWTSPSFMLPNTATGYNDDVATYLSLSTLARQSVPNQPLLPTPTSAFSMEPNLHPLLQSAMAIQTQRQNVEDIAWARQHMAAIQQQQHQLTNPISGQFISFENNNRDRTPSMRHDTLGSPSLLPWGVGNKWL